MIGRKHGTKQVIKTIRTPGEARGGQSGMKDGHTCTAAKAGVGRENQLEILTSASASCPYCFGVIFARLIAIA